MKTRNIDSSVEEIQINVLMISGCWDKVYPSNWEALYREWNIVEEILDEDYNDRKIRILVDKNEKIYIFKEVVNDE